jgi:tartrate dehydratase alpha subunit/fumarate hydratase class I-like protein
MSVVETDLQGVVEDAAAHLYVWALKDIPQDLRDALADAAGRETSVTGKRVLDTILKISGMRWSRPGRESRR